MTAPMDSVHDTVWKNIPSLKTGASLDSFRKVGIFTVVNPTGGSLPSGRYFLRTYTGNIGGIQQSIQIVDNAVTGVGLSRAFGPNGWTAWAASGGGGAGDASTVTYTDTNNNFGNGVSTNVASVLDDIAAVFANIPAHPSQWFDVRDYGGVGDGVTDNRAAFEAAITAADAVGGGVIYAPRGTWMISGTSDASIGGIRLRSNMILRGDGVGLTIIKAQDIGNQDMTGVVRTESGIIDTNVMVIDLTIDGNKSGQTGWANIINFYCGVTPDDRINSDKNIFVINVESKNARSGTAGSGNPGRGYGVDPHEIVDNFVLLNCVVHDNELDGVIHDGVLNFKNIGVRSHNNGRHGFNYVKQSFNGEVTGCYSHNNGANGFLIQQDSNHINIIGCRSESNAEQGIRLRRGTTIINTFNIIANNTIKDSGRSGINITGACYNQIIGNLIENSSQSLDNTYFDVNLQRDDGDSGVFSGPQFNVIRSNSAYALGTFKAKAAYREDVSQLEKATNNTYLWNEASGQTQDKYKDIENGSVIRDRGVGDVYNVKDWGAKGDGTTDDRTSVVNALDFAVAAGGGIIYFPPGVYYMSGTGTASQGVLALPSNITLQGSGQGATTLHAADPVNNDITGVVRTLSGANNSNISIRDLTITVDAVSGTGGVTLAYIGGSTDQGVRFERVTFTGAVNGASNIGYGIRVTPSATSCYIDKCISKSNARDGIYLDGCNSINVSDCTVDGNLRHGINMSNGGSLSVVRGCYIHGSTTNNILISEGTNGVVVSGCTSANAGEDSIRIRRSAAITATNITVHSSIIQDSGRDGISFAGSQFNSVVGCSFKNNGSSANNAYYDVSFETDSAHAGSSDNNVIHGNSMIAVGANKTSYGINESATFGNLNTFSGNYIAGQVAGTINVDGASTIVESEQGNVKLVGRAGGQTIQGGVAGSEDLTLESTAHATKGNVFIAANELRVRDAADATKLIALSAAGLTTATTRTITIPDKDGTLALLSDISATTPAARGGVAWGQWSPNAGSTSTDHIGFGAANAITGTATSRSVANTNRNTASRRLGYVSASTVGSGGGFRHPSRFIWRGNAAGLGGFNVQMTFALAGAIGTTQRGFFGVAGLSSLIPDSNKPSLVATTDMFGVGFDDGATNFSLFHNDNVGNPTVLDLGANFPVAADEIYHLTLECPAHGSDITYTLDRLATTDVTTGTIAADIPRNNIFMNLQLETHNGTTAEVVDLDIQNIYYEVGV